MVTDGTVTKSLGAWFWESISVILRNNSPVIFTKGVDNLEVGTRDKVLQREVYLKGDHTEQLFAGARSTVSLKHLTQKIGNQLEQGKMGIN